MKCTAPRSSIKAVIKKQNPDLRMETNVDLLIHLNCLLFLQRLATESRLKAFEERSTSIKPEHIKAIAKMVLKKSKG
ncbi:centromere protein W [Spea bombifrons]|uniref:centromere protein W n=1 Tax=Spea bombifrons TaxID=233779 RepID=UPI00234AB8F5|nr:centromere protein W [Spea bombifrons]